MGDSQQEPKADLAAAPAQEKPKEGEEQPTVPPKGTEGDPSQPDFAAMYEVEKTKRGQAEFTIEQLRKTNRDLKKNEDNGGSPAIIDPDTLRPMVEEHVRTILQSERQEDTKDILLDELEGLTDNEDERKLILLKYQADIQKSGYSRRSIREDLEKARDLAYAPLFRKNAVEAAEALKAKHSVGRASYGANVERFVPKDDLSKHFSEHDWNYMTANNWSEDMIRKAIAEKQANQRR